MKTILLTGAAGFIGSHVLDLLVERGYHVIAVDNMDPQVHTGDRNTPHNIKHHLDGDQVEFRRLDVRHAEDLANGIQEADAVIHLAAAVGVGQSMYEPAYFTETNVHGQGLLMEAMQSRRAQLARFVVASSMSLYGEGSYACVRHGAVSVPLRGEKQLRSKDWEPRCPSCGDVVTPQPTDEDHVPRPTSIYASTKKSQEEMALAWGSAYHIPTMALRFFNVYGPRQSLSNPYTGVAAIFISRLRNDRAPLIFEDGEQTRDFIYVTDVARAVVRALEAPKDVTGAFNVCTGRPTSVREIAVELDRLLETNIEPAIVKEYRAGDIRHCVGSPERLRAATGFEARVSLEAGLEELIEWARTAESEDRVDEGVNELRKEGLIRA